MCRTVLIFNVYCEHEHAEIQKCSHMAASEQRWQRKGFFSKMFSSSPRNCKRPQQTRNYTKAQVCSYCSSLGITYEKIRKDRDAAQRRPPRPIYRNQTDLSFGNPDSPPGLQRSNAMRQPADRRPQGLERSNTVQFHGEAPRLPNVRATAIFRESETPLPDTLRHYLGSSGVPSEDPERTDNQRPPPPSTNPRNRRRPHSDRLQSRSGSSQPYDDNGASLYINKPLPPAPLRPRRPASSASRPPPVPDRSSSQRRPRSPGERQSYFDHSSSQPSPVSSNDEQLPPGCYSSQWPLAASIQLALTRPTLQNSPHGPSYHRGRPTDRELNRMSMEIETVESAWVNAGRRASQQQP
ncbi:hypothetical protein ACLOAV_007489 [Pseudogymnoascus australis]